MSARIIRTVMLGLMAAARATPGSRLDAQQAHPPRSVSVISGRAGELIDRRFESLADSGFSGALIVVRDDSILLEAGYGFANRERRVPFTAHTIAQVGSLTKQFTATAIADLMQRHTLHPTDSLGGLFPDIPAQARGITLHMLLTHTSGLADDCGGDFARRSREELLSTCLAQPLLHSPGTTYAYSNLGYNVLAAVLEKATGQSLEAYLHDRFFAPLHLDDIGYAFPGADPDTFAIGYGAAGPQKNIGERIKALGKD